MFLGVNSNDFATVYLREACAKLSLPKREEREDTHTDNAEAKKYGGNLQAGQRKCRRFARRRQLRLAAVCSAQTAKFVSLRLLFRKNLCLCQIFFRSAVAENIFDLFRERKCACLGGAERRRLYQDRHT